MFEVKIFPTPRIVLFPYDVVLVYVQRLVVIALRFLVLWGVRFRAAFHLFPHVFRIFLLAPFLFIHLLHDKLKRRCHFAAFTPHTKNPPARGAIFREIAVLQILWGCEKTPQKQEL